MKKWIHWIVTLLRFAVFYAGEILVSNLRVARDVLAPRPKLVPGVLALSVADLSERQIVVLAALLTMTPGTLSLEADRAAGKLYLHCLYLEPSADGLRRTLEEDYVHAIRILV